MTTVNAMMRRSEIGSLSLLPGEAAVRTSVGPRAPTWPDPDEAALMEEAPRQDARSILCGVRRAAAFCLALWGAVAALVAWLA
jgi:hypothetical protein